MSMPSKWLSSMETIQANPVFAHMTWHSRWPSLRTTVWLFIAAVLVGTGGTAALLFVDPPLNTPSAQLAASVIVLSGLAVVLLSPPVAAVMTTIATVTDVQSEAYRLMQVSLLPKEEIVSGYLYAALYRLRLLWVLAFGLFPPLTAVVTIYSWSWDGPVSAAVNALIMWIIGMALGYALNRLAVCFGVWQSLRSRRIGPAVTTVMVILGSVEVLVCAACWFGYAGLYFCPAYILTLMIVFLAYLTDKIRR